MKKIAAHIFLAALFFIIPSSTQAACQPCPPGQLCNPICFSSLDAFLVALLGLVVQIGFPIIVLFIVYIGFRFVQHSASGNAEELKKDREYLLWAVVGALILLGAQALAIAIEGTVADLSRDL